MLLPDRPVLILALFAISLTIATAADVDIKWCVADEDEEKCKEFESKYNKIKCTTAPNIYRCLAHLKNGIADVALVSDTELYPAGKVGLKPLLQLIHENSADYRYKAVAVIKAGGKINNLADLKDAKSCHTGAGKTTGWTVPISNLIKKKILPTKKSCYSTTENVAEFFSESCVPGAFTPRFNPLSLNPPRLCSLCASKNCSREDEYAGYDGAKLCLEKTDADIAFVKHETMLNGNKTKYKLLCPSGKIMELNQFDDCHWAVRPTDTIVVSPKTSNQGEIASQIINNLEAFKNAFELEKVQNLKKTTDDYATLMGDGFKATFEHYHNCKQDLRWCVISDEEMKKCTDLKYAFMSKRATNYLDCVKAKDHYDCMTKIEKKEADFVVLDGGDISTAINNCKLEPVIAENYGVETATYYTVAVAKATSSFTIKQLKGKKSCHTGIGKTSGWKSPISYLVQNKFLSIGHGHSIPEEVGEFFNASCVPGALDPKYNPDGRNPKSLCALCPDNGKDCQRNSENKYYDYSGAFRCLVETDADVAFIKHTTVSESTDGNGKDNWDRNLKSEDYRLLCKDGSRAPIADWKKCHLAKVPAHAIVVRKDENVKYGDLLFRVFNNFDLSDKESLKLLFSSSHGKNYLFKDSTKGLIHIENPKDFLGKDYLEIVKIFGEKLDVCSGSSPTTVMSITLLVFVLVNYFSHF